jgi:N-acetylmuramic acid 6-phosphate etherase
MAATDQGHLPLTEQSNERTANIGSLPVSDVLRLMNDEDKLVAPAVERALPDVALAVGNIVERLQNGGRLFYIGTGTSGRLGVLDASECPPTFGVSPELIQGVIAGGYEALYKAVESSEDDRSAGGRDLTARGVTARDAVVGIAASGRTPYTIGAVKFARGLGAFTAAVTCVPGSAITTAAEVAIVAAVGPEVLTGSTRLKAGTAQKMVLNMISTATLIRLGYVSGNRMSNVQTRNSKLHDRAIRILMAESNLDEATVRALLDQAGGDLPATLVMSRTGCTADEAKAALRDSDGVIDRALAMLSSAHGQR